MAKKKTFQGESIREVWDFRLSTAVPQITRVGGTWVAEVWAKNNSDYNPEDPSTIAQLLEAFDTGIAAEGGDEYDTEKVKACYAWFYKVRDKYALDDIEDRKPLVAQINAANDKLATMGAK